MLGDNLGPIIGDFSIGNVFAGDSGYLKIAHFNAQSLCPSDRSHKFDEMVSIFGNARLDIICVTETWLSPAIFDQAVALPGYSICRSDRPLGSRGGGVAIYVAEGLKYKVIYKSEDFFTCEGLFIEIQTNDTILSVGAVYLPRGDLYSFECNFSEVFVRFRNLIIVGDFNVNMFDTSKSVDVRALCSRFGLVCWHNYLPTHSDHFHQSTSLIDYFIVSSDIKIKSSAQFQIPLISRHSLICASFAIPILYTPSARYTYYRDFKKADLQSIKRHIALSDFSGLYNTNNPDLQLLFLERLFYDLMFYIPLTRARCKDVTRRPRFPNYINYHRSLTSIALVAFYRNRTEENWSIYRNLRNRTKSLIRKYRKDYYSSLLRTGDSRQMWNCLRNAGVSETSKFLHDVDVNDLNERFLRNQLESSGDEPNFSIISDFGFSFSNIDEGNLFDALTKIKSNSVGSDGLSIKFIKFIYPFISKHLLYFFNSILTTSIFPSKWKISRIIPIPKSGSNLTNDNMRPISILPTMSKIFEIVMKEQMTKVIVEKGLLNDCQYGFRRGHSTVNLLTELTDIIRSKFNIGRMCVLVSVDLSKAFDQVDHSLLIKKLFRFFEFSKSACRLIWSYLNGRWQYVSIESNSSSKLMVRSGVPQGSVIGPILFTMFLNDFFTSIHFGYPFAYADDIQLLWSGEIQFSDALQATINDDLTNLDDWMCDNKLTINTDKTKAIIFKMNSSAVPDFDLRISGRPIIVTNSLKCLGLIIDENLSFDSHIDSICSRVCYTLRRLYHLNLYLPLEIRKSVAHALLMTQINYGIVVYSGCNLGSRRKIRSIIHKIVRFVYGLRIRDHVSAYLKDYLNLTFESYLKFRLLIYLYNIIRFQKPVHIVRMITFTRSVRNPQILIDRIHNSQYERSFVVRVAREWNSLPLNLRCFNMSLPTFGRRIIDFFNGSL